MNGIKWAHDNVGLPDLTKYSFVLFIQEASRRKTSKTVNRKEPKTNDLLRKLCENSYSQLIC